MEVSGPQGKRLAVINYDIHGLGSRLRIMIRDTIGSKEGCVLEEKQNLLITKDECSVHLLAEVNKCIFSKISYTVQS